MSVNISVENTSTKNSIMVGVNFNEIKSAISSLLLLSKDSNSTRDRISLTVKNVESKLMLQLETSSTFAVYSMFSCAINHDEKAFDLIDKPFTLNSAILKTFFIKITAGQSNKIILIFKKNTIDFIIDTNKISCKLFKDNLAEGNIDFNPECNFNPFVEFSISQEQLQRILSLSQFYEQETKQKTSSSSALMNTKWVVKRSDNTTTIDCFSSDSLIMSKVSFQQNYSVNISMLTDLIKNHEVKINDISFGDNIESVFYLPGKLFPFLSSFINTSSKTAIKEDVIIKWNDSLIAFEWSNRKVVIRKQECKIPNLDIILDAVRDNLDYTFCISKSKLMESIDIVQALNSASQLLVNDFLDLEIKDGFLRMRSLAESGSSNFLCPIFIKEEDKQKYNEKFVVLCRITKKFKDLIRLLEPINTDHENKLIQWQETTYSQMQIDPEDEQIKDFAFLFNKNEMDGEIESGTKDIVIPTDLITLHLQYTEKAKIFYVENANFQSLVAFRSENL